MSSTQDDRGGLAAGGPRLVAPAWGADLLVVADAGDPERPAVRTVPVGANPRAVAASTDGTRAYTADHDAGTLSVVDLGADGFPVLRSVPAGQNPCAVVAGLVAGQVCVADRAGGLVMVFDKEAEAPAPPLSVGSGPSALAAAPGGQARYVCVVDDTDDTVTVVDVGTPGSPSAAAPVPVPGVTRAVVVAPGGRFAYVASRGAGGAGGLVTVLDLGAGGAVVGTPVPVGAEPRALALSPDGNRLCVAGYGSASVSVATVHPDTGHVGTSVAVPVGPHPVTVAFTPDGSRILVVGQTSGTLTAIDTDTLPPVTRDTPVGAVPAGVVPGPDGRFAYITDQATGEIVTVRTAPRKSGEVTTGTGSVPVNAAAAPDGTWAYAADSASDKVAVLNLGMLQPGTAVTLGAPHKPWDVAVAPDRSFACATSPGSASLLVLTDNGGGDLTADSQVKVTPVALAPGAEPHGVAITPDGRYAVTADSGTATLSLVDPRGGRYTIAAEVVDCEEPTGITMAKDGTTLYVADFARTSPGDEGGQITELHRTGPSQWERKRTVTADDGHLSGPHEMAVTSDGLRLCVANYQNNTVSVLRRDTTDDDWTHHMTVTKSPAMLRPYGLALSPDGNTLYVSSAAQNKATVEVFDISTKPAVHRSTIAVTDGVAVPPGLALSPDGTYLYAAVGKLYGVDLTGEGQRTMTPVEAADAHLDHPSGLACRDDRTVYVVNQGEKKDRSAPGTCLAVLTLDATRLKVDKAESVPLTASDVPYSVTVTADGTCCIANLDSKNVTVLTSKVIPVPVGTVGQSRPWDVAVTDDGAYACATDRAAASLRCIRLADQHVTSVGVGQDPMGVASGPGGARIYVACHGDDSITVLGRSSVQDAVSPGGSALGPPELVTTWQHPLIVKPESVSVSPDGTWLFVTCEGSGTLLMVDTANGIPRFTVPAGRGLTGSVPDPRTGEQDKHLVYVTDGTGAVLSVVDTTTLAPAGRTATALDVRQAVAVPVTS
ncbi:hypothetical protein GCM10010218_59590 [Streptomyces mashuensis]|uniref:Uncharacterized protein n=1 Tax=Streptomyces mashuensis TaxID=33904 RepID=A0A919EF59_9ACTN|nr:beta-propeller fold lactonase family protein [Streptomyces mashuensis]GHF70311.1 hypothetical protein GCM10010218_59590 [Streptomyces mashuensis]